VELVEFGSVEEFSENIDKSSGEVTWVRRTRRVKKVIGIALTRDNRWFFKTRYAQARN